MVLGLATAHAQAPAGKTWPFAVPDTKSIPSGPMGDAVRHGQALVNNTRIAARRYVGNGLNCSSCHLNAGTVAYASPWVGIWGMFPEYRSRDGKIDTLQDRINDCFERSMNGKALPSDSPEMLGILSYIWWLSSGVPTGMEVTGRGFLQLTLPPSAQVDPVRGKTLYAQKCSACHGPDGQGRAGPTGAFIFPPLWGPRSFNIGAGMARLGDAAEFIKAKMPRGADNSLSDQDAFDIAAYFTRQPRPDFARKNLDWPKGGKPADARY